MQYRPDFALNKLGTEQQQSAVLTLRSDGPLLRLRWLRTLSIDCSVAPVDQRDAFVHETLAVQQRSVLPCAVQRVVVKRMHGHETLQQYLQSLPLLISLNLRGCSDEFVPGSFLCPVADAHPWLQRLYLPQRSLLPQSTLERFKELEELDVTNCQTITNVDFCAATLRVLYADRCPKLTSAGLQHATKLEVLHVVLCQAVSNVSPFAHRLLELRASYHCGIDSAALSQCYRLQVLDARCNDKIDTLRPFAVRLRELHAGGCSKLGVGEYNELHDAALAEATHLVKLNVYSNPFVTTVAPFGSTLIELNALGGCGIDTIGLATATNLVCLIASDNSRIQSVAPFASALLELGTEGTSSGIGDAALALATRIVWLDCTFNKRITMVAPFGSSLRHIVAMNDSSVNDAGLTTATNLVTLNCSSNPKITSLAFCATSLQELIAQEYSCGVRGDEIATMGPQLWKVEEYGNYSITVRHLEGFTALARHGWLFVRRPFAPIVQPSEARLTKKRQRID